MEKKEQIQIVKNNGESVTYDPEKLKLSLSRAGATDGESYRVIQTVESKLFNGVPSKKIYEYAHAQLKKQKSHRTAGRFRLKKAIFNLGPSGYPFEIFVGRLFESFGYSVKVGVIMQGKCVQHEVDVVARKPGELVIVETKFRGDFKGKTTVQVPLYIHSRFSDIEAKWKEDHPEEEVNIRGFVVTNTRFTLDAIKYAECVGLGVLSWDYPSDGSLKYFIDLSGLHPLTSLLSLKKYEQRKLLDSGIVLCRELENHQHLLHENGIPDSRIKNILKEAKLLILDQ